MPVGPGWVAPDRAVWSGCGLIAGNAGEASAVLLPASEEEPAEASGFDVTGHAVGRAGELTVGVHRAKFRHLHRFGSRADSEHQAQDADRGRAGPDLAWAVLGPPSARRHHRWYAYVWTNIIRASLGAGPTYMNHIFGFPEDETIIGVRRAARKVETVYTDHLPPSQ